MLPETAFCSIHMHSVTLSIWHAVYGDVGSVRTMTKVSPRFNALSTGGYSSTWDDVSAFEREQENDNLRPTEPSRLAKTTYVFLLVSFDPGISPSPTTHSPCRATPASLSGETASCTNRCLSSGPVISATQDVCRAYRDVSELFSA